MNTGIHTDMSNTDYHNSAAIGSSMLKELRKSPLHCWDAYINPDRERKAATPAMQIGTCFHTMLLEPETASKVFTIVPEGIDRRSKEGKALFAEIDASGVIPLKKDDHDRLAKMVESAKAHPVTSVVLSQQGLVEASLVWTETTTGLNMTCKMRPDFHVPPCEAFPNGLIVDLKSAAEADYDGFSRAAFNMGYYIQSAWYTSGFMAYYGTSEPPAFLFLAVEKERPFACAWYAADQDMIELGNSENTRLLHLFAECASSNHWPGYPTDVRPLSLPAWAKNKLEFSQQKEGA